MNDKSKTGSFNISTGWVYNQEELVLKILENFPDLKPRYAEGIVPSQINQQSLKSTRWDWKPSWTFDEALKGSIEKYRQYHNDWGSHQAQS